MIRAYNEIYLYHAQNNLAVCFDYSINILKIPLDVFWNTFINSDLSLFFESGDAATIAGKSGIELAHLLFELEYKEYPIQMHRSKEYWLGYVLAYYQWFNNISFKEITRYVTIQNILYMYYPYHEVDITIFCEQLSEYIRNTKGTTNLKLIRMKLGISQSQLSKDTGIPLRTIQQYEQGQKNINKAQVEYLVALSTRLYCSINDLLEI